MKLALRTGIPLEQAHGLLSQCVIVDAPWEQVLAENGLELVPQDPQLNV